MRPDDRGIGVGIAVAESDGDGGMVGLEANVGGAVSVGVAFHTGVLVTARMSAGVKIGGGRVAVPGIRSGVAVGVTVSWAVKVAAKAVAICETIAVAVAAGFGEATGLAVEDSVLVGIGVSNCVVSRVGKGVFAVVGLEAGVGVNVTPKY